MRVFFLKFDFLVSPGSPTLGPPWMQEFRGFLGPVSLDIPWTHPGHSNLEDSLVQGPPLGAHPGHRNLEDSFVQGTWTYLGPTLDTGILKISSSRVLRSEPTLDRNLEDFFFQCAWTYLGPTLDTGILKIPLSRVLRSEPTLDTGSWIPLSWVPDILWTHPGHRNLEDSLVQVPPALDPAWTGIWRIPSSRVLGHTLDPPWTGIVKIPLSGVPRPRPTLDAGIWRIPLSMVPDILWTHPGHTTGGVGPSRLP
jgi:hypothetical protein